MNNLQASQRTSRMWRRLGEAFAEKAEELAGDGSIDTALRAARAADVCFWQATGEMDGITMERKTI